MAGETTDVLIVGAGPYGLSCAWWIKQKQPEVKVLVLDAEDFAAGGISRVGSGMRMQWGLELNIRLCQESITFFEDVATNLDYPRGIDLKQEGYLLIAHDPKVFQQFEKTRLLHERLGVPSELLSAGDCIKSAPGLNPEGLAGGSFCQKDGTASPFLWMDALLTAVRRSGVTVRYNTRVSRLSEAGDGLVAHTENGDVAAAKILICTDWAAPELLSTVGVEIPITGMPKQGLVTEPWPQVLGPMVVDFKHDLTLNQVARGNFVAIVAQDRPDGSDTRSTPDFLHYAATQILDCLPALRDIKIIRTWGGVISKTPDMQSVLEETEVDNLYIAVSAYKGFMTSPAVGRIMSEVMFDAAPHPDAAPFTSARFKTGRLLLEPTTV